MSRNKLGIFIAYILRHNPSAAGIALDERGWARVDELIAGVRGSGYEIDLQILEHIVATDNKSRFSFNDDKSLIRANQGHSIPVEVEMEEGTPPDTLFHGTAEKYLEKIKQEGIVKKTRNFVHLSKDEETAVKVGARHGKPVVLVIDSKRMASDGCRFLLSLNGVWQTEYVAFKYVKEIIYSKN